MYKVSFTVVFLENENKAYNWLNGEYVEFYDLTHPFLEILKNKTNSFSEFKYNNSYDDFQWLVENKFIIKDDNEIKNVIKKEVDDLNNSNELSLIILPADNACNFRCVYCYEDHRLKKYMKSEELTAVIEFIKKQKLNKLHIEFFGGEPLLNKSFILDLSTKLKELSKKKNFILNMSMTTNAYNLDVNLFKKFLDLNLKSYQITIDGLEEDHDILRPLENGKGIYRKIFENLIEISKLDTSIEFSIMIRVNFNTKSATKEKRNKVLLKFKKYFGRDKRFSFIFRPIGDYASANNTIIENSNEILCKIDNADNLQQTYEEEAIALGLNVSEMQIYLGKGSAVCYAGKKNSLIIDSSLNVKKCTVALNDPINIVGKIDKDGNFIKNSNWSLWTDDNLFKEEKCSSCFFISQCQSNNCRLKNIKNNFLVCPNDIIENKYRITNKILNYLDKLEEVE